MTDVGGERILNRKIGPVRVSRTLKRTPTRQQMANTGSKNLPFGVRQQKRSLNQNSNTNSSSKLSTKVTEDTLDRFVYERLFQKPKNPYVPEMPKNFFYDPKWLHKCEECGDAYVNEATFQQHITRRTMKITVKTEGQEPEVFYNRCNFLAAMRKTGRSQTTMNKSNITVEPLIGELAHLLHGGDLNDEALKKSSDDIRSRLRSSKITGKLGNGDNNSFIKINESQSSNNGGQITDHFKIRVTKGPIKSLAAEAAPLSTFDMKCPECNMKMATRLRLKQHLDREGPQVHNCGVCQLPMPNDCSLKAHERLHSTEPIKPGCSCMCPECGLQFVTRESLLLHIHQDCMHGFLVASFQCPHCDKLLSSSISLEAHLLNEHTKKVYKCTNCHLVDHSIDGINEHIAESHPDDNKSGVKKIAYNTCELCPEKYIKSNDILFHVHKHAENSDCLVCYSCGPCNVYVETKEEFREHKMSCNQNVSKFCTLSTMPNLEANIKKEPVDSDQPPEPANKQRKVDARPSLGDEMDSKVQEKKPSGKISVKSEQSLLKRRKSDEDLPPAKKHCIRCGGPTKATKNTACMYCRTSRVSVLSDDSPFKQRLTITQRGVAVEEINTEAFEDAVLGKKQIDDVYECYLCKEKLVNKYGDIEHHFQEKHSINFTSRKINTKNFRTQLELMRSKHLEKLDAKFQCKFCLYRTDEETEFNRHMLEHKPLKPVSYICKACDINFAMKSCLIVHLEKQHRISNADEYLKETGQMIDRKESPTMKENQCKVCYKEFNTALELSTHFRIHGMAFLMNKTRAT